MLQKRTINKVAVLGSGIMGSRIACHFAGIGVQVLLLDLPPKELNETEKQKGQSLNSPQVKNRIVNEALASTIKSSPSPIFTKDVLKNITTGNFEDDMKDIASCDWIIEVVVERLDIKKLIYEQVLAFRADNPKPCPNKGLLILPMTWPLQITQCKTHIPPFHNEPARHRYAHLH